MPTLFLIVFVDLVGFGLVIPLLPFYAVRCFVRTLAHFKDPRAPEILETAYLENLALGRELNALLQQQCLTSMADCGGPIALKRLVLVAKEPPATGNEADRQETLDRRITAVRGLAKFKDPEATAALAYVLKSEKDVAMRDRAHESLQACTGKRLPPDSPQWAAYLPQTVPAEVQPAAAVQRNPSPPASPYTPLPQSPR